jgi:hypothetical protein
MSRELRGLAGVGLVRLAVDAERQAARLYPDQLAGAGRVSVAAERLAWQHLPVPQFGGPGRAGGADERAGTAGRAMPHHARYVADADSRFLADIDQLGHWHAERIAEFGQRRQVRVRAALLKCDEHALAHAGPGGQLIQ